MSNNHTDPFQPDLKLISFEEELLINYDDYLRAHNSYSMKMENYYDLELEDLNKEYDENDWEEEEEENSDEEISDSETFLM
ncbi:hypothetical protein D3C86_1767770 [compost metagenome]